ncbi:MAG: amino acid ABC transporter substrate-binding protein [Alphaproteobacteria bacterium]
MKYAFVLAAAAVTILGTAASAGTLDLVMARGFVKCGVSEGLPGFSSPDENGNWSGIDVDICRAVAAALFGDPSRVTYTPLSAEERFEVLREGEIDVLSRNTTWTLVRDTAGLEFAAVNYFDGQAFMVREDLGVRSALELDGAAICVTAGTTTRINLADYFQANEMTYSAMVFPNYDEMIAAYDAGKCDAYTADQSALYAQRTKLKDPDAHIILPGLISKEPLGPVVRQPGCQDVGDRWVEVIRWTLYAMLEAEERGVSSRNVDDLRANSKIPGIRRLLGVEGDMGKNLGLTNDWGHRIIKLVGNYAEVFERNLGPDTPLNIPRGVNALWKNGGLQYPMPIL